MSFDGFNAVSCTLEAMDECRKQSGREFRTQEKRISKRKRRRPQSRKVVKEDTTSKQLKHSKFALGKNSENLTHKLESCLNNIKTVYPEIFCAYQLKKG